MTPSLLSFELVNAREIMQQPVVTVPACWQVRQAREMIETGEFKGLVLLDPGGDIAGAVSSDQLSLYPEQEMSLSSLIAPNKHHVIPQDTTLAQLINIMRSTSISCLILTEPGGRPTGILDIKHLCNWLWDQLIISNARLKTLLDTVNEAITIIDQNNVVVEWNRKAEELYNIPAHEISGKPIDSFFTHLVVTRVMKDNREVRNSYHQPCEGTHVLINAKPITSDGCMIGSVSAERDITEIVLLHQDLSRVNTRVRMLEKEINKINGRRDPFRRIIGHSPRLAETINLARRVANTNAAVLIRGESGTGKELFAEAIHQESARRNRPLIAINCGAIPHTLFESELFGYSAGAFTGADRKGKPGKFELANGGTLFLDEIGELHPDMQVKLLRVLQKKVIYRVGGNEPINVDVRILASTHRNLESMIAQGLFREDLYYRLNVVSLEVPALRERREDIPELTYAFIYEFAKTHNRVIQKVEPEVMSILLSYHWPGNIRELRNLVERMVILAEGEAITVEQLPPALKRTTRQEHHKSPSTLNDLTKQTERVIIQKALEKTGGNKARAARQLGIPRSTLYYKIKVLRLDDR